LHEKFEEFKWKKRNMNNIVAISLEVTRERERGPGKERTRK
jgi:hypothetical protein